MDASTMAPLEAAEKLEWIAKIAETDAYICTQDSVPFLKQTASLLRAIAAGEYKRVVHAHYGPENRCSVCGAPCKTFEHCANKPSEPVCWNCGALMDDSEEQKK